MWFNLLVVGIQRLFKSNLVELVALVQTFSLRGVSCHWSLMGYRLYLAQESVSAGACAVPLLGSAAGVSTGTNLCSVSGMGEEKRLREAEEVEVLAADL